MQNHWTYTTSCHCCGTECDHHIPTLEADPEKGLSYESFEITVQRMPEPIWRKCRKCCANTRNIVVYYDEANAKGMARGLAAQDSATTTEIDD
jgi:hypothetical protein